MWLKFEKKKQAWVNARQAVHDLWPPWRKLMLEDVARKQTNQCQFIKCFHRWWWWKAIFMCFVKKGPVKRLYLQANIWSVKFSRVHHRTTRCGGLGVIILSHEGPLKHREVWMGWGVWGGVSRRNVILWGPNTQERRKQESINRSRTSSSEHLQHGWQDHMTRHGHHLKAADVPVWTADKAQLGYVKVNPQAASYLSWMETRGLLYDRRTWRQTDVTKASIVWCPVILMSRGRGKGAHDIGPSHIQTYHRTTGCVIYHTADEDEDEALSLTLNVLILVSSRWWKWR